MKKTFFHICTLLILLAMETGCKKRLESLYYSPDQTTQPAIEKFFTRMLDNNRVRPAYWEIRTFAVMHTGIYSQSVAFLNSNTVYQQNPEYAQERWNDFYIPSANGAGVMAMYRSIEAAYNKLSPADQTDQQIFKQAAGVVMMDQAAQLVDLWGDIPYSEAGSLDANGQLVNAKFDSALSVYKNILDGLNTAANYFRTAHLSPAMQLTFNKQDILLSGDLNKWQRYTNSLRLRLWMRMSFYNEAIARQEITTLLSNPVAYPLVDGAMGYQPATTDILLQPLSNYTDDLHLALTELSNFSAPDYLLNQVMKPSSDPRIPVMFDKYGRTVGNQFIPNTDYNGFPQNISLSQQQALLGNYAVLDSATFIFNSKLPGILMTAAEVNFLKAEAYERWGGDNPQLFYELGIRQSIAFYYYLNSLNSFFKTPLDPPKENQISNFLQNSQVNYNGTSADKLGLIWTQKWVHFGFLQSVQNWAECRRTKFPVLNFYPAGLPGYELPPARLVYPASESSYNPNYKMVKNKDFRTVKVFWDVK